VETPNGATEANGAAPVAPAAAAAAAAATAAAAAPAAPKPADDADAEDTDALGRLPLFLVSLLVGVVASFAVGVEVHRGGDGGGRGHGGLPALWVAGDDDVFAGVADERRAAAAAIVGRSGSGVEVVVVPRAGHFWEVEFVALRRTVVGWLVALNPVVGWSA